MASIQWRAKLLPAACLCSCCYGCALYRNVQKHVFPIPYLRQGMHHRIMHSGRQTVCILQALRRALQVSGSGLCCNHPSFSVMSKAHKY